MDHFTWRGTELFAEDTALQAIAAQYGTPTYVYSKATLERHVKVLQQGVGSLRHVICYAIKANGNQALLELLRRTGCGFDAVSGGELARALKAGAEPQQIIVSGVGKSTWEIEAALRTQVLYICVESEAELLAVARVAAAMAVRARISVRINPDVDAQTHPYISTGLKENKFGVPYEDAAALFDLGMRLPAVEMVGVCSHIGSQITSLSPFVDAARKMAQFCALLRHNGVPLQHVGIGGGLGVVYHAEAPPDPAAYGAALAPILAPLDLQVVFEPGRVLVANAGGLLPRVVRNKQGSDRRFVIVDAGMNDLLRPALYGATHRVEPVMHHAGAYTPADVVGPVCESADTFAHACSLPPLEEGAALVLRTAGAYGAAMASPYNGRRRAAEVLCDGATTTLIRQRDTIADLWRHEHHLDGSPVDDNLVGPFSF